MNLPSSNKLPIQHLSSVFNDTTNSYKFYWFLSILNSVKKQNTEKIIIDDLVIEMIANVWYPINYYRITFGKQDTFSTKIEGIKKEFGIKKEINKEELINLLSEKRKNSNIKKLINDLARYVPYRFLTPWFSSELRGEKDTQKNNLIINLTEQYFKNFEHKPLYKFSKDNNIIEIDTEWTDYLVKHIKILEGYTLWNLILYLQKNNPNIPNIQEKLFAPTFRDLSNARKFWSVFLNNCKKARCVYSDEPFELQNLSIDHFIPWCFVTHDQLWNLLPVSKYINSAKSDNIPSDKYLRGFSKLQFDAFHFAISSNKIRAHMLEDYSLLFNDTISGIASKSELMFEEVLTKNIKPLMQIAINMGFNGNWIYKK